MSTGLPSGQLVEVEFTAGVWTDVTSYCEFQNGIPIRVGRTSPFSDAQTAEMQVVLDNRDGRFSPQRQVLNDGTTTHPYWPNILPHKRIRYSYLDSGAVRRYRFTGSVKSWPPNIANSVTTYPTVTIEATDRMDQLSRVILTTPIRQEIVPDAPLFWWPLTDDAGSIRAFAQQSPGVGAYPLRPIGDGPALTFGDNGPGVGDGTGVKFSPASATSGQILYGPLPALGDVYGAYTIECYVNAGTSLPAWASGAGAVENIAALDSISVLCLVNGVPKWFDPITSVTASASIVDGAWHHLAATRPSAGAATTLYVDGVSAGSSGTSTAFIPASFHVGDLDIILNSPSRFQGNIGQVAVYLTALSAARIAEHAAAGNGYYGDLTGARIARHLEKAGLTSSNWTLDAGVAIVNTYPQAGKAVLDAVQDVASTEGGGAVVYVNGSDSVLFKDRTFRKPAAPVMTLDASTDLDASIFAPAFDDFTMINTETVSRSAESGTLSTQSYTNAASQTAYGTLADSVTTYTTDDGDALNLAQFNVNSRANPGFRLPQVAIDLVTAEHDLYDDIASVFIGSRIRVTNLPAAVSPTTQLDLIVEGWEETPSSTTYQIVFDTSPADNPPRAVWDDTNYGRWQCAGQTLNASLTNSATTVVIATAGAGNPTFTTVSARYPLNIKVGEEVISLQSAPGGSTSPQTFTGCLRGQQGTTAAAQASAATVNLYPANAWCL